jgi:hypothetical protein
MKKVPYSHEATNTVSSTALALKVAGWGVVTINGDSETPQLSSLVLFGVNKNNSNLYANREQLTLWWKLTDSEGTRTVSIYKDGGMASGNLVAQGTSAGDGTVTLAAQNSSGIYGTVDVTYTGDDTDYLNQIVISPRANYAKVTIDANNVRYWTDNTVPTATDGHLAVGGANTSTVIELVSAEEIMNFRFIRESADAKYSVTFYDEILG